jgi:tryptophan 2-monooxygenase
MSFFSPYKKRHEGITFTPSCMIDVLFDYGKFLRDADRKTAIAGGPDSAKNIAVVGSGAAGLVAAYELSKISNLNVTLYEAGNRLGGRMDSLRFSDGEHNDKIFEFGCMRFPPNSTTLYHYLKKFDLHPVPNFPDPGVVHTQLLYENQVINWPRGQNTPDNDDFQRIGRDLGSILVSLLGDRCDINTKRPRTLFDYWAIYQKDGTKKADVVRIWQAIIDRFKDMTFYNAMYNLAQDPKIVETPWSQEDMNKFGALGVGSGGFSALFAVNFIEIIRLFPNGWELHQELLIEGIGSLVDQFEQALVDQGVSIRRNSKIRKIEEVDRRYALSFTDGVEPKVFDAVIVATTTRAMEYMGFTLGEASNLIPQGSKIAIRSLHLMNSSKLFITTETKFWYKENNKSRTDLPSNIQTDELLRGLYCLDYDTDRLDADNHRNPEGKGVVLMSYVWGDDSSKLLALSMEQRYHHFLQAIRKVNPLFADLLDEQREEMKMIDWTATENHYGAFKVNYPGQEQSNHDIHFQYQSRNHGVFLAGDSVSFAGGWMEGAMSSGVNAASAVARYVGASSRADSPLTIPNSMYKYDQHGKVSMAKS